MTASARSTKKTGSQRRRSKPAKNRSPRKAETVQKNPPVFQGWATTNTDEIERRRWRGATEIDHVEPLEPDRPYFGTFAVRSASGRRYVVEIRDLERHHNSCDCLDWQTNALGTCKHIEGAIVALHRKRVRAFRAAARTGSDRVEVFPAPDGSATVRVRWPEGSGAERALGDLVDDADGTVSGDPLDAPVRVQNALTGTDVAVRVSRYLEPRLEEERRRRRRRADRDAFLAEVDAGQATLDVLHHPLMPYQHEGMLHLAFGERALIADEMGLGKTVQAIAACELLRQRRGVRKVLVVAPASLKAEWEDQIARFTDRSTAIVAGRRAQRLNGYESEAFFVLVNYEQVRQEPDDINRIVAPDIVVLDEAQRIKNWETKTARAVKQLASPYAFVLTGTPLENRIDEIYSIVQYLDPKLLGPLFRFNREFYVLDEQGRPVDYQNLDRLHARLSPVMLRRRKADVQGQLPGRTVNTYYVSMTQEQHLRYADYEAQAARLVQIARRRPLTKAEFDRLQQWLACMRMICDSPYILDPKCRDAPKLAELENVLTDLLSDASVKVIIFSEWVRMLELVGELVSEMGHEAAWHTGKIPQDRRRREIRRFKQDPACRILLSTSSGGLGLNLQVASAVVNVDLPWNPARLEQRIARAWRRDQTRAVSVINLVCEDSIEHRIQHLVQAKQALADGVLDGQGDLGQLKMPSSRAGRVEQMAAMIERMETPAAEAPDPARTFAETAGQHLDRALVAVARCRNGDGQETALIVVDDVPDDSARRALDDAATAAGFAGIRVLDRMSWETIRQLADAGVLQFAGEVETLHANNGSDAAAAETDEAARRRVTAQPWLETSDRKLRMAEHLAGGGFEAESVDPLRAAAAAAVRAIALMRDPDVEGDGLDEQDALDLAERPSVSAELPAGTAAAFGSSETWDSDEIAALRTTVRAVVAAARAAVGESASAGANRKQGRVQSAA
jgi:superfamily II DNA or RNA helicase